MERKNLTIAIVDDQSMMRKVVVDKLAMFHDLDIIFEARNGREMTDWMDKGNKVDLILMDVQMPHMNGIEATLYIKSHYPRVKILMLSVFDDDQSVFEAIKVGAEGYLLKDVEPRNLYNGILDTLKGGAAMTPSIAIKVLKYLQTHPFKNVEASTEVVLSQRETEVLQYLSKGMTYKLIAEVLFLSPSTVRKHIENIYTKLSVRSKMEAVNKARKNNLIT